MEARVFSNPLRVKILNSLVFRPASALQLAADLNQPLNKVVYHTTVLQDAEYIQPAEGKDGSSVDQPYEASR